jgi:HEAT repeat protein
LGKIGPDAKGAVTDLSQLLLDGEPAIRQAAADALAQIGPGAEKAAPMLAALLRDPTPDVRFAASKALIQIGPAAKAAVPEATAALDDCQWDARRQAADALGGIAESAATAIPALTHHLADPEPAVRISAAAALASVASRLDGIALTGGSSKKQTATALTNGWSKLERALPGVLALLHDVHPGVRAGAAELVGRTMASQSISSQGDAGRNIVIAHVEALTKQSVPALTEALGDCEYRVRIAAVRSLGQMGYLAANPDLPAVKALLRDKAFVGRVAALLHDSVDDVRQEALAAMMAIMGG